MGRFHRICVAALVVVWSQALAAPGGCQQEDGFVCDGDDHRPVEPASANSCHQAATLAVEYDECIVAGFFDEPANQGLNGRNAKLASLYVLADYADADELAQCDANIDMHTQRIADAECAAPSTDCGPAPDPDNPCHAYAEARADYRQRCDPDSFTTGSNTYEAQLAADLAKADYATAEEQQSPCQSGIDFWLGPCADN